MRRRLGCVLTCQLSHFHTRPLCASAFLRRCVLSPVGNQNCTVSAPFFSLPKHELTDSQPLTTSASSPRCNSMDRLDDWRVAIPSPSGCGDDWSAEGRRERNARTCRPQGRAHGQRASPLSRRARSQPRIKGEGQTGNAFLLAQNFPVSLPVFGEGELREPGSYLREFPTLNSQL
jgi:hypothetical protein